MKDTMNLTAAKINVNRYFEKGGAHFVKVALVSKEETAEAFGFTSKEVTEKLEHFSTEHKDARYAILDTEY